MFISLYNIFFINLLPKKKIKMEEKKRRQKCKEIKINSIKK